MGNININGSGTYSTLNSAVAAASATDTINITGTWSSHDTTGVTWDVAVSVRADSDSKQDGKAWQTGDTTYRLRPTSGHVFTVTADVDIHDINIISDSSGVSDEIFRHSGVYDSDIRRCIIGFSGNTDQQDILYIATDGGTKDYYFESCQVFDVGRTIVDNYKASGTYTIEFNGCTFFNIGANGGREDGCLYGNNGSGETLTLNIFSCIISVNDIYVVSFPSGTTTVNYDYNLTNITQANFAYDPNNENYTGNGFSYTFTDAADPGTGDKVGLRDITTSPYDLRLTDHANNDAIDFHSIETGPDSGLSIPNDINNTARGASEDHDVGSFEVVAGGGSAKALAGTVPSIAAFSSSSLLRSKNAAGSFAAVAAFSSSSLLRSKNAAGSFAVASSFAATPLSRLKKIIGSFANTSAFTAEPIKRNRGLTASAAAISFLSAIYFKRTRNIIGSFASTSTLSGLYFKRLRNIIGSFGAASAITGAITKAGEALKVLAGVIVSASVVSSNTLKRYRSIEGSLSAAANITSTLNRLKRFAGSFAAVSAFTAALTKVAEALKVLAGTITGISLFSGNAPSRSRIVQGNIDSISSFAVATLSRLKRFAGSFAVVSGFTAALTKTAAAVKVLVGAIASISTISGTVPTRLRGIRGSFSVVSVFTAALTKTQQAIKVLVGAVAEISSFSATAPTRARNFIGSIAATSIFSGQISRLKKIIGSFSSISTFIGLLITKIFGTPTSRTYTIANENRVYAISDEDRVYTIAL